MRAAVITGAHSVEVRDVADAVLPGPDGAVVQITKSAICGSDLHFYDGDMGVGDGLRIGHEGIGTVVEVGADVRTVAVGDRVLVSSVSGCGMCVGCATGDPILCRDGGPKVFGSGELGGAQAEALAVPVADFQLRKLSGELSGISDEAALLLTDNLPTGWIAARKADFQPGATVAVIGLGSVGLCAVRSALVLGAGRVLAADLAPGRRALAEKFGAEPPSIPRVRVGRQRRSWRRTAASGSRRRSKPSASTPPWTLPSPPSGPAAPSRSSAFTAMRRTRCRCSCRCFAA